MNKALIDNFNQTDMHNMSSDIREIYTTLDDEDYVSEQDNRGEWIFRPLFSHSSMPDITNINMVRQVLSDEQFFYFVTTHYNQPLWSRNINVIPFHILDAVRKGKCKLVFDNTLEGKTIKDDDFLIPFYNSIDELNLPPKNIYFITNNLLAEKQHMEWLQETNRKNYINVISYMYNVGDVKRLIHLNHLPNRVCVDEEMDYKTKNLHTIKPFLKINRTGRPERDVFMLFLNKERLLDKCLISFPRMFDEPLDAFTQFSQYLEEDNIINLRSKIPFDIDRSDETNHGPAGVGEGFFDADLPFNSIHYKNSFISIVMCAFPFENDSMHLHSSTFNPIYCGHPIIQFGPYKALSTLRKYGFKTFYNWWDEGYDNIEDPWDRLDAVIKVVYEISQKNNEELLRMYIDMKEVLQHNVDVISNFDVHNQLTRRLLDES